MASNTIKGLTVEIGGDTTKLGKALEGVNKKSRDLSAELGQINKLLKMDPGNTDLLAQKQKVLAEAVTTTTQKLDTLREAEKQVQKQFERGEVSEDQVRALQREIVATTKKLDNYEKAAKETKDAIEGLGKESDDVEDSTKKVKKGADKAADSLDDYSDKAEKAEESSDRLARVGGAVGKGLAAVGAAVAAAGAALIASAEASREYRAEMGKLDAAFNANGHSAETATATYKTLQGVIGETDQSVEAAQQISLLAESTEDAAKWAGLAAGVVGQFGDALQSETFFEAANETLKLGEATGAYVQMLEGTGMSVDAFNAGLAACNTEAEKQAYMLQITEKQLGAAGERYKETNAEVIRANQANEEWAAAMAEVGGAVEPLLSDVKLLGASLLKELVPGVKKVTDAFRAMLGGDEGAGADLGQALSGIITQMLDKVTSLLPQAADAAVSLVTTLASSIIQSLPQLLSTGAQIVGSLITGLASAAPGLLQQAVDMIGTLVSGLQQNLPLVLAKGAELLAKLGEGIRQGLPSLVSQALDIIMNLATTLYDNAPMLIETGFDLLSNLVQGILDSLPILLSKAPEIVSKFANIINDNAPTILKKGFELVVQIVKGIIQAIPTLVKNIPKIITALVDVWEAFNWANLGKKAMNLLKDGIKAMIGSVKSAGTSVMNGITGALKNLPSNLANIGKSALSNLGGAIRSGANLAKSAATNILNTIFNTLKGLPSKMLNVGKDLVRGLWNGISDMAGWVVGKIQGFGDTVLSGIKKFFGIKSPSRVFRDQVGKMLAVGMAEGIEENADQPLDALSALSTDMVDEVRGVDGLAVERQINHSYSAEAMAASSQSASMLSKLDQILKAIEHGQILTINGDALVGATANAMNNALGQRRVLAERGAV